jgi:hypothetical protein
LTIHPSLLLDGITKRQIQSVIEDPYFFSVRLAQGSRFAIQQLLSQLSGWDGNVDSPQGKRLCRMMTVSLFEQMQRLHAEIHQETATLTWSIQSIEEMDPKYIIKQVHGPKNLVKHTFMFNDISGNEKVKKLPNGQYIHQMEDREYITKMNHIQPMDILEIEGLKIGIDLQIPTCLQWSLANLNGERKDPMQLRLESDFISPQTKNVQWKIAELDFCRRIN